MGHLAQRVQVGIRSCVGVLHGYPGAELDVLFDSLPEWPVVGHAGRIERIEVEVDEPPALLLCDRQAPMHVDQVSEAELFGEAVGTAERFGREPGEVFHVLGLALSEERSEERIGEHLGIEDVL